MRASGHRIDRYRKKIRGLVLPGQTEKYAASVRKRVEIESLIRSLGVPSVLRFSYIAYAEELLKKQRQYGAEVFDDEGNIIVNKWVARGLDKTALDDISWRLITWMSIQPTPLPARYEYYITGDDSSNGHYALYRWAQTFTIGTTGDNENFHITAVKLKTWRTGNPGTITIGIYEVNESGKPTGSALTTGTFNGNSVTTSTEGEWITISLTPYLLSASTKYAIVMSGGINSVNMINYKVDASSPTYTGGQAFLSENGGLTWTGYDNDFMFETWGICP